MLGVVCSSVCLVATTFTMFSMQIVRFRAGGSTALVGQEGLLCSEPPEAWFAMRFRAGGSSTLVGQEGLLCSEPPEASFASVRTRDSSLSRFYPAG